MPLRPPHPGQLPKPPRRTLRHALSCMLAWALRGLALLTLGYLLAVAVLGVTPRPAGGLSLPACCLPGGAARNATEQQNGAPVPAIPGQPHAPETASVQGAQGAQGGENAGMAEAPTWKAPRVTIHVISNGVHADIVLPVRVEGEPGLSDVPGLADVTGLNGVTGDAHLAIGWGAREFYLATPTWDRMRPGVALRALALAPAALHVEVMPGPPLPDADTRILYLSRQGYRNLVAFVAASLARDAEGRPKRIPVMPENGGTGYGPGSLFFEATGRFSPFRTCNTWAADALAAAGARTPVWTPLPHFVLYHLPGTPR